MSEPIIFPIGYHKFGILCIDVYVLAFGYFRRTRMPSPPPPGKKTHSSLGV